MPAPISVVAYAERRGVNRGSVYRWIRQGQLTGAAITTDGKIVVEIADEQVPPRYAPQPAEGADMKRAALLSAAWVGGRGRVLPAGRHRAVIVSDAT